MKTIRTYVLLLGVVLTLSQCSSCEETVQDLLTDTAARKAIDDKYNTLLTTGPGWSKQNTVASGDLVKTKGGKGYVQYYTYPQGQRAIYYYPETGAFGFEPTHARKYKDLGEETFRDNSLGLPTSDQKSCGNNCTYNEFQNGIIITKMNALNEAVTVYGDIYKKFSSLNKWSGVLGYPTSDELDLTSRRGRYNVFQKGQIYWNSATGAQAFWGKTEALYKATGFDTGWLGLPTSTTSYNEGNRTFITHFEKGDIGIESITVNNIYYPECGYYLSNTLLNIDGSTKKSVLVDGKTIAPSHNCY